MQKQNEKEKYLSIGEASEHLGVSIDTLRRWEVRGKLKTYRSPGGHRYFKKQDLDNLFGAKYQRDEKPKQEIIEEKASPDQTLTNREPEETRPKEGKSYYQDKLNVPRFIRRQTVSKYDILFATTASVSPEDGASIPAPTTIESGYESSILVPEVKKETPEEVSKEKPKSQNEFVNLKNIMFIGFILFLILDLILFLVVISKPIILSPTP